MSTPHDHQHTPAGQGAGSGPPAGAEVPPAAGHPGAGPAHPAQWRNGTPVPTPAAAAGAPQPPQGDPAAGQWGPPPPGWGPPPWAPQPGWGPPQGAHGQGEPANHNLRRTLQILCLVLVAAGLSIPSGGGFGWSNHLLWAIFATAAAATQLCTLPRRSGQSEEQRWTVAAIAVGALVAYWVVIVLPGIAANGAFVQTLGVGAGVIALWLTPGRRV